MSERELATATEFIKDKLYYVSLKTAPRRGTGHFYFSIDNSLVYWNFFLDFGPLNLGQCFRFCQFLKDKLELPRLARTKIYFYSDRVRKKGSIKSATHCTSFTFNKLLQCISFSSFCRN